MWRTVVVSTPRQMGKSWLIRAAAMVRAAHPIFFGGEPQTVVHVANRHLAARRIHSMSWGWAEGAGLEVRTAQGQERIVWPDGSCWDALTLSNVYGSSANLVLLDEVWDVRAEDYREALRPTQRARRAPQLWALSTAHRRAGPLMSELMADGRDGRGRTLLLDWGARVDDDVLEPRVWAAASPWWDEQQAEELAAEAGSQGFAEQSLNVWPEVGEALRWLPRSATDRAGMGLVRRVPPDDAVCGVECSLDGQRWAVAAAWSDRRGVKVRVWRCEDLAACLRVAGERRVKAHQAVLELAPRKDRWRVDAVSIAQHRAATSALRDVVRSGVVAVAGIGDEDWVRVRTTPADGGEIIDGRRSLGDVHAVKAAAWAVWAVVSEQEQSGFVF